MHMRDPQNLTASIKPLTYANTKMRSAKILVVLFLVNPSSNFQAPKGILSLNYCEENCAHILDRILVSHPTPPPRNTAFKSK